MFHIAVFGCMLLTLIYCILFQIQYSFHILDAIVGLFVINLTASYNFSADLGYKYLGVTIQHGASGALTYCEASMWQFRECDTSLNGLVPFN